MFCNIEGGQEGPIQGRMDGEQLDVATPFGAPCASNLVLISCPGSPCQVQLGLVIWLGQLGKRQPLLQAGQVNDGHHVDRWVQNSNKPVRSCSPEGQCQLGKRGAAWCSSLATCQLLLNEQQPLPRKWHWHRHLNSPACNIPSKFCIVPKRRDLAGYSLQAFLVWHEHNAVPSVCHH